MTFSIRGSLRFGWQQTKANSGLLFKVLLTLFALQVLYAVVSKVLAGTIIGFVGVLALTVAEFVVGVGLTLITLRIAQSKHVEFKEIIPPLQLLWRYFLANILVGLIIAGVFLCIMVAALAVGAIAGVISGGFPFMVGVGAFVGLASVVYLSLRFSMVRFAVLDGAGVVASLKCSREITKKHTLHIFGFVIVLILLNILGAIALLVGLLVTLPVTLIAYAHIYQTLHAEPHTH